MTSVHIPWHAAGSSVFQIQTYIKHTLDQEDTQANPSLFLHLLQLASGQKQTSRSKGSKSKTKVACLLLDVK